MYKFVSHTIEYVRTVHRCNRLFLPESVDDRTNRSIILPSRNIILGSRTRHALSGGRHRRRCDAAFYPFLLRVSDTTAFVEAPPHAIHLPTSRPTNLHVPTTQLTASYAFERHELFLRRAKLMLSRGTLCNLPL